ncbi:helix-turn-helix domain-containing protein [Silvimonas sp. JCM 19000]
MDIHHYASVWDAIEATPGHAEEMKQRAHLMMLLKAHIKNSGQPVTQIAVQLGLSTEAATALWRGKINAFDAAALLHLARKAGVASLPA